MAMQKHATVLIAGGSVAGLALANMLEQTGIDYLVLEKYSRIAPDLGASIGIFPNGCRILDQLGCYEALIDLVAGKGCFNILATKNSQGETIADIPDAAVHLRKRTGYEPFFVDRQMLIQALYDNLKDKTKIHTSKGVAKVDQQDSDGVHVTTLDRDKYSGDILVGADGIHSTVRREMWRIADQEQPDHFNQQERNEVKTEYCCIFGISRPTDNFPDFASHTIQGQDHSYLLGSGPGRRIYWFLFKKLEKISKGLYDKIPRYTEAERDALAAEHANDRLSHCLSFGDLYNSRTSATLQALPEVVFSKWHYGRIITIGDAAHKFNPIGGQGGNSAIEDAAVLVNKLYAAVNLNGEQKILRPTANIIETIFKDMQNQRHGRASSLMDTSHNLQSIQAMDSFVSKIIAKYIMPRSEPIMVINMLCEGSIPAARLDMIDLPARQHIEPFFDELPARPLDNKIAKAAPYAACGVFAILAYVAKVFMKLPDSDLPTTFLGEMPKTQYTGIPGFDAILTMIVLSFSDSVGWIDPGHTLQFLYLLSFVTPLLLIWYIEGYRAGSRGSLISWPTFFGLAMHIGGIGVVAPLYFLFAVWAMSGSEYRTCVGRHIPESIAKAIFPATYLGYVTPTLFMFFPLFMKSYLQELIALWPFVEILVGVLVILLSKAASQTAQKPSSSSSASTYEEYSFRYALHLLKAYKRTFLFSIAYHILSLSFLFLSTNPSLSFARLFFPTINLPEQSPSSNEAQMFTFLKYDFFFAAIATILYGLYSVFDLRVKGQVNSQDAVRAGFVFLGSTFLIGPGAAFVGLWWWREARGLKSLRG
ncbi:FAD/NAD(P)-binding domain-containing protein [Aaosphaeria arxii CBS 175.79]|uniref:FAD/NAD(P)-binding domain-containing protein n=1 Tax=Aaosphaeria arxii CBS 175.79 TaxID=1450172 RepID=A0A6A5XQI3_9PLEO|nr:FAD/NAD(P)-binding domain-containing protein [Aaosphaeria arxii CBS 175.79]KAF2015193.1 FAD/NAD(P)-binding domain-containing protein [Aaosphaeria arxii CBS 175.79]